jgi:PAS domain-containing protein
MRHDFPSFSEEPPECLPVPERGFARWMADIAALFQKNPEKRWGGPLLRIASDMILVCNESLEIVHHNRAFLKAIGHTSGTYRGTGLDAFFPENERESFIGIFQEWRKGHAAGMRLQAPLLTTRGTRSFDLRVVRCRDKKGDYHYYLIGREASEARRNSRSDDAEGHDPFFQGLPVAAWRTDAELRITRVYGSLWPELGAASEDLVGEVFGRRHDTLLPEVLRGIDCTDTLTGMSLQTELVNGTECFNVTVEPFLDTAGRVVGTVGLLRRAIPGGAVVATDPRAVSTHAGQRPRHHQPPGAAGSISIVTGRVPRFFETEETGTETRPIDPFSLTRRLQPGGV